MGGGGGLQNWRRYLWMAQQVTLNKINNRAHGTYQDFHILVLYSKLYHVVLEVGTNVYIYRSP